MVHGAPGETNLPRRLKAVQESQEVLIERYHRDGDQAARDELAERLLPLARALALRYRGGSEPVDDLVQVAALGLVKALDRFDPDRGSSFEAYAVPTILGELKRHFRDRVMPLHMPRGVKERALTVSRATEALTGELDRSPTIRETAARSDISEDEALEALRALQASRTVSLDAPMRSDDGEAPPVVEAIGSRDPRLESVESDLTVHRAMKVLDDRELHCVRLRFAADLTQEEIADEVGVSQVHVSRILRRALDKMRDATADLRLEAA
jgi:RNA polymerase sigma-B factor